MFYNFRQPYYPCLLDPQLIGSDGDGKNPRPKMFDHELVMDSDGVQRGMKDDDGY